MVDLYTEDKQDKVTAAALADPQIRWVQEKPGDTAKVSGTAWVQVS